MDPSLPRSMVSPRDFAISTIIILCHLLLLDHHQGILYLLLTVRADNNSFIFRRLPRSSPSSPAPSKKGKRPASASPIRRRLLSSPLLNRRMRKSRGESSDEEGLLQDDSSTASYRDLETFQKAQLRQKVCIANIFNSQERAYSTNTRNTLKKVYENDIDKRCLQLKQRGMGISGSKPEAIRRDAQLVMHNKAPMWNESSQVYQLDFGGRVTQESAKNFQIEFRGRQVRLKRVLLAFLRKK